MKFSVASLAFLICTTLLSTTEGRPLRPQLRCRCAEKYVGKPIPSHKILALNVIPAGVQCKHVEIIATMKKGVTCLNPKEKWVNTLKEEMKKKTSRVKN
ncbi:C-X-C motif chemokine 10-like [Xyrauchen texanus]|uniref:C-X-C motif chemokine 10-like n=1 Tax=Xyrauchen texanus TaxID=154827 RepID=UPI002242750C|nr:C-X-C motif chemokine 10-like [Xyrauchen texanus]